MNHYMPDGNAIGLYLTFSKNPYPILISRATGLCATPRQTKIGYTNTSFYERMNQYRVKFRGRFEFWPIIEVPQRFLIPVEKAVIDAMNDRYGSFMARSSGEWFDTGDRLQDRIAVPLSSISRIPPAKDQQT